MLDGYAWKTIVSLLFWAQHRSNPPRSAKHADKFNTRNTQPRRSVVVKLLCVFIVLEDKVIPCSLLPLCITMQHTHTHIFTQHTHTHTHTDTHVTRDTSIDVATRNHTLPLDSFFHPWICLASKPTPPCFLPATDYPVPLSLENQSSSLANIYHPRTIIVVVALVKWKMFTCALATMFPYLELSSTDRSTLILFSECLVCPSIIVLSPTVGEALPETPPSFSRNPCPQVLNILDISPRTSVDIRNTCYA